MVTFRQALRTLDAGLLEHGYRQWLRKPANQDRVDRAVTDIATLEQSIQQRHYYLKDQVKWGSSEVLAAIEGLPPEVIYHLWREQRTAYPYPESRQFPIPFKQATRYLKLMELFLLQHVTDRAATWTGYYEEVVSASDEVGAWLLANMNTLPFTAEFPVERLGAHKMFRLEHAENLFALNKNSLRYMARNRHLTPETLQWVWVKMEENFHTVGSEALRQLAQNTAPAVTSEVCDQIWEVLVRVGLKERTYSTVSSYLADNPASSDDLLIQLAEGGYLTGMPRNREAVPERVVHALLENQRRATRIWAARNPQAVPYLETWLTTQETPRVELLAAIALNPAISGDLMSRLAQNRTIKVRSQMAKNLSLPHELAELLAYDRSKTVRKEIAYNRAVPTPVRFLAEPTEKQVGLCLKADRGQFLDWVEVTYPELAGLPESFLIQILPTVVAEQVNEARAVTAEKEFI